MDGLLKLKTEKLFTILTVYFSSLICNFIYLFIFIVGEVNRLELELQRVQKENLKNENLQNSEEYTSNGESKPEDYVNKLEAEIQNLKSKLYSC